MLLRRVTLALVVLIGMACHPIGLALAFTKPNGGKLTLHRVRIDARTIRSFTTFGASSNSFGRLKFRGGLVLKSSDPAFGGFSGLEISPDGRNLIAVSDAGGWLKARINYDEGRLKGLSHATIGPILALGGRRLRRGRDRDAEAIRIYQGSFNNGIALVGFELNERVGLFDLVGGQLKAPRGYLRPPVRLVRNKGIEATAVIRKGRHEGAVVAFAERSLGPNRHHRGWMWPRAVVDGQVAKASAVRKGRAQRRRRRGLHALALTNVGGFDITDVTGAKDGGLYVLERRFRWSEGVQMRIRRIKPGAIKPGAVLRGKTLIRVGSGHEIDNMEGIAVHVDARGRTVLTLISDNNFNSFLQRTVLLQFEVPR